MTRGAWLVACGLAGCASTSAPPDDARERGLGALRQELELAAPVGRVERDASGAWLVHGETGVRLCRVPDDPDAWNDRTLDGPTLLFEGAPGAALVFDGDQVRLARYDRAARRVRWSPVFEVALPKVEPLLKTQHDLDPADASATDEVPVTARLDLAGHAGGVDVALTSDGLQVTVADHPEDAEPLYVWTPFTAEGGRCANHFASSVGKARLADGTTVLRLEIDGTAAATGATCEADYSGPAHIAELVWVAFPPDGGRVRVLSSDKSYSHGDDAPSDEEHSRRIELGGATLYYRTEVADGGGWGPSVVWHWSLERPEHDPIELVSGTTGPAM